MAVSNSLIKQNQKPTFSNFLTSDGIKTKINSIIGGKDGTRFIAAVVSAVSSNPDLAECDHPSILSAALLGESLNLSPSPTLGQYYMVPFKNKKKGCKEAVFVLGYKGYIQLAIRSGQYKKINVIAIKEGELIKFDPLTEEIEVKLIDDEDQRESTPTVGYYSGFEYINGFRKAIYWSISKMRRHADKYSSAYSLNIAQKIKEGKIPQDEMWKYSSYWYADFDGQAYKTMLRQLISKWGIMSIDLQKAFENDMTTTDEKGVPTYVDDTPVEPAPIDPSPIVPVTETPAPIPAPDQSQQDTDDIPDFMK